MNLHAPHKSWRWANISDWLSWLLFLTALFYLVAGFGNGRWDLGTVYSSDAMYVARFYRDVLARGTMAGWILPPNPYFFPDMLLFVPIDLITGNIYHSVLIYSIVQLLLLVTGMLLLQRHLFGVNRFSQTLIVQMFAICMILVAPGNQSFYNFVFMNGFHFGVLVVLPFATVAMLRALHPERIAREQRWAALILFVLTLLTSLSDSLFIIQFVVPALVASWVWFKRDACLWRLILVNGGLLLAAVAGQWLRQLVVPVDKILHYTNSMGWEQISTSFSYFTSQIVEITRNNSPLAVIWLSSVLALVGVLLMALLRLKEQGGQEARPTLLIALLLLGSMVISVVAVIASGNFNDPGQYRYLLPTIYLPLFAGWPLLLATVQRHRQEREGANLGRSSPLFGAGSAMFSVILLGSMFFTMQPANVASLLEHRTPLVECLERETALRHLHYGISTYWQANSISVLSSGKLELVHVLAHTLRPYLWITNRSMYEESFQFIMQDQDAPRPEQFQEAMILQKFGQPAETFTCEDRKVYVYNRQTDLQLRYWFASNPEFAEFDQVGDEAEFYGYSLPSAIGGVAIGLSQGASDEWQNIEGRLAYADLLALPVGSYAYAIELACQ